MRSTHALQTVITKVQKEDVKVIDDLDNDFEDSEQEKNVVS